MYLLEYYNFIENNVSFGKIIQQCSLGKSLMYANSQRSS